MAVSLATLCLGFVDCLVESTSNKQQEGSRDLAERPTTSERNDLSNLHTNQVTGESRHQEEAARLLGSRLAAPSDEASRLGGRDRRRAANH